MIITEEQIGALILYTYTLGGNTREIARLTRITHDEITNMLWRANHLQALKAAGITEDEWRDL
jgi:hypothetical protein